MNEIEVLRNSLNVSICMLGVTAFLSICTVTFGAINMGFQRSHNIKSVKPFCNIHTSLDETGISISIMNAGLGPMIIQKIVLLKSKNDAVKNGTQILDLLPVELHYDTIVNKKDYYILPATGEMKIVQYSVDHKNKKNAVELLKSTLDGLCLCVIYRDIYDYSREKRDILKF